MGDIRNKNFERITLIEWIFCFFNKINWDEKNPSLEYSSASLVWQGALKNSQAKYRLFWLLALSYLNPNNSFLSPSIIKAFNESDTIDNSDLDDTITIEILGYLKSQNPYKYIAALCFTENQNPDKLLSSNNLPSSVLLHENNTLTEEVSLKLPEAFSRLNNHTHSDFFILLDNLTSIRAKHQITFVENILEYIPPEEGSQFPQLGDWLKKNYGIASANSAWNQLSHDAKIALRKWIGALNYKDFENLSDIILNLMDLKEYEKNRIESRKYFWSNYTDRFERIRILLPSRTYQILSNSNYNMETIELLESDGSQDSEVCIFDFSPFIIVEFFRGNGSETIIFDRRENYLSKGKKLDISSFLFESKLSAKK
ncbi:hypothetical protein IQ218_09300 [Synechocystis salina LEGE 06099]|uniref:EH signature domain-containing protein n=1 Tax=Synechocystis salina TaxID=945780 RepID=UPI00187EEF02|nr:EH signature domain-containing protein [Synechocystis salina]MBE9203607.1 hypothetical protein [Synechocystis salina LEGE 06099]